MSTWSLTYQKAYSSDGRVTNISKSFTYKMAAKTSWNVTMPLSAYVYNYWLFCQKSKLWNLVCNRTVHTNWYCLAMVLICPASVVPSNRHTAAFTINFTTATYSSVCRCRLSLILPSSQLRKRWVQAKWTAKPPCFLSTLFITASSDTSNYW